MCGDISRRFLSRCCIEPEYSVTGRKDEPTTSVELWGEIVTAAADLERSNGVAVYLGMAAGTAVHIEFHLVV